MPVPKRKTSKSRRDKRHANTRIEVQAFSACNNCNDPIIPHSACQTCGFYKGKKIFITKLDRSISRRLGRHKVASTSQAQHDQETSETKPE